MTKNKKTYLVLGANGFVGSYLVDHLAKLENVHVRAFDRFSREPEFYSSSNVEVFKGDFLSDEDINGALDDVDYVLHSFSATTPFISDNDPYIDISHNLQRSIRIFELCVAHNVKKIGFVSSGGAVYGIAAEKGTVSEDSTPLPVSPYGINKLSIEHYLEYFKRKFSIDYTVYRLTNPYGPRQRANNNQGVIPTFLGKIKHNEEITILGDGSATRDYIYMPDAASMISSTFGKNSNYNIYNIGSGVQTSLNDIVETIKQSLHNEEIKVQYKESPATFLKRTSVSIDRFYKEFGEVRLTSLAQGIKATINNQR